MHSELITIALIELRCFFGNMDLMWLYRKSQCQNISFVAMAYSEVIGEGEGVLFYHFYYSELLTFAFRPSLFFNFLFVDKLRKKYVNAKICLL